MDTPTIVTVALAINVVVAALAITLPWLMAHRARSAARRAAEPASGTRASTSSAAAAVAATRSLDDDPGQPWFPATSVPVDPRPAAASGFALDASTALDLGPAWTRWLAEEEARVRRFHRPATIVLVELAGLDRLAERLGGEAADRLIPPIATTLRRDARATDHLARLGPTRFAALLTETTEVQAINWVERVRSACDVWLESGAVALRLSIGWSEIGPDRPADVALLDAERRLFAERERTRRQLARPDDDPPIEMPTIQSSSAQPTQAHA
ncbi:MAG TPA: diguanylate cyclase [Candidatus Limnocylindrales bacterium]|jgi:diguanylate cyclase (GGDEF)-like protein